MILIFPWVIDEMIIFRLAKNEDFDFYYNLKCEESAIYWGGFEKAPDRENFHNHFNKIVTGNYDERQLLFALDSNFLVGFLQLTRNTDSEYEISYGVSEHYRGHGYGYAILEYAKKIIVQMERKVSLIGYVRYDNIASIKCFQYNGFLRCDEFDERFFPIDGEKKKMYLWKWSGK